MSATVIKVTDTGNYSTENEGGTITHFVEYEVTFDDSSDPQDESLKAMTAVDPNSGVRVPKYGSSHPFDAFSYVKSKRAARGEGPHFYRVTVGYRPNDYNKKTEEQDTTEDPMTAPVEVEYFGIQQNEPIDRTIADEPIENSSGEPFDPPITEVRYDMGIRIRRVEKDFDPVAMVDVMLGTVNRDRFMGFSKETVLFEDVSAKKAYKGLVTVYWVVEYTFRYRSDGWKVRVCDKGYRVKSGSEKLPDSAARLITDSAGNNITQPAYLNNGAISSTPIWLEFETKDLSNFDALGFKF